MTAINDGEPPWLWDVGSMLEQYLAACCSPSSKTRPTAPDLIDLLEDAKPTSFKLAAKLWSFNGTEKVQFSCSESTLVIWDNQVIHVTSLLPADNQNISQPLIFHDSISEIHRVHCSPDGTQVAWTLPSGDNNNNNDDDDDDDDESPSRTRWCQPRNGLAKPKLYIATVAGEVCLKPRCEHMDNERVVCIAWNPRYTNTLACGSDNATVWIWQGEAQPQMLQDYRGSIRALAWSYDGLTLAAMDKQNVVLRHGKTFDIIRRRGRAHPKFSSPHLAFSRDGRLCITYLNERVVEVYDNDWATLNVIDIEDTLTGHLATPWSHDAQYLAFQTEQGIHIYDGHTFNIICKECTRFPLICVEWYPSALQLAVLDSSKQLSLYKFIDRRPKHFFDSFLIPDAETAPPIVPESSSRWLMDVLPLWVRQFFQFSNS